MTSVSENHTTDLNFRQMERFSGLNTDAAAEPLDLPPGFRFHPTDEELITHYLCPKALDGGFSNQIIGEVNLNQVEPWDLPWRARMGEKEWYFFCVRDRKYPSGSRTNRATDAGYWKATGKDKEIFRRKALVGMKKTLVFYRGRAPRGEKTGWVMHEYRLVGKNSMHSLPKTAKKDWVICRVFKKGSGGKKVDMSGPARRGDCGAADGQAGSCLPPLMDLSGEYQGRATEGSDHVTCFSNSGEDPPERLVHEFSLSSNNVDVSSRIIQLTGNLDNPSYVLKQGDEFLQDPAICSYGMGYKAYQDEEFPVISGGQVDLDWLWNY